MIWNLAHFAKQYRHLFELKFASRHKHPSCPPLETLVNVYLSKRGASSIHQERWCSSWRSGPRTTRPGREGKTTRGREERTARCPLRNCLTWLSSVQVRPRTITRVCSLNISNSFRGRCRSWSDLDQQVAAQCELFYIAVALFLLPMNILSWWAFCSKFSFEVRKWFMVEKENLSRRKHWICRELFGRIWKVSFVIKC